MASTRDVLDHHTKSFGEGDLEGILSDYAPDAVLFTPDGPLKGVDAIRPFFQAMLAEFGKPGTAFSMKHTSIEGDYSYVIWAAETACQGEAGLSPAVSRVISCPTDRSVPSVRRPRSMDCSRLALSACESCVEPGSRPPAPRSGVEAARAPARRLGSSPSPWFSQQAHVCRRSAVHLQPGKPEKSTVATQTTGVCIELEGAKTMDVAVAHGRPRSLSAARNRQRAHETKREIRVQKDPARARQDAPERWNEPTRPTRTIRRR
jgi:ketosteroid isomerase-like protein